MSLYEFIIVYLILLLFYCFYVTQISLGSSYDDTSSSNMYGCDSL